MVISRVGDVTELCEYLSPSHMRDCAVYGSTLISKIRDIMPDINVIEVDDISVYYNIHGRDNLIIADRDYSSIDSYKICWSKIIKVGRV